VIPPAHQKKETAMKRLILAAGLAVVLIPLSGPAQYPGNYSDAPEQMVRDWFRRYLRLEADPQAAVWIDAIKQGQAPEAVLSQILGSSEYYLRAGSSVPGFVRQLHIDLTGRPPSQGEISHWSNLVYQSDRHDVAYQMLQRYPQHWGADTTETETHTPPPTHDYRRPSDRYYPRHYSPPPPPPPPPPPRLPPRR